MALLITFILGLFFLLGAQITRVSKNQDAVEHVSLAAAMGALFFMAVGDLIPEILEEFNGSGLISAIVLTAVGLVALKLLDHFVPEHDNGGSEGNLVHIGVMSVIAISLHNIAEGMTVYNIARESLPSGLSLMVGVGLHNIPMGMMIWSMLHHERRKKKYVIMAIVVLSSFVGGLGMSILSGLMTEMISAALVCITLGMVLYILCFELIPSILHEKKWKYTIPGAVLGIVCVLLSVLFE